MNCGDCLHYEVCELISKRESLATLYCAEQCPCFTDKSEVHALNQKIANQREEIKRLRKCLFDTTNSRGYWKSKANRIGKQLQQVLEERRKEDGSIH